MSKVESIERSDLIKPGKLLIIAGPCSMESENQIYSIALKLAEMGVKGLRGMFRKPRTEPESFQGPGLKMLPILREIKRETGLIIVSEIMREGDLEPTRGIVDVIQIGSRNMQNYPLLEECMKDGRPIILKRGLIATIPEWMGAARYAGLDKVILCERGVRAGSEGTDIRFTLDLGGALVAKESGLPVIGDPSHPAGNSRLVPGLANAIVAAGLDGLLIEVHEQSEKALSDKGQQITPATLREILGQVHAIHRVLNPAINLNHNGTLALPV